MPLSRAPSAALPVSAKMPVALALTLVTSFQAGHGWTTTGTVGGSTNLNDTSDFTLGSQAAAVQMDSGGAACNLGKLAMAAINMTGRMFQVWVKVDDISKLNQLQMFV